MTPAAALVLALAPAVAPQDARLGGYDPARQQAEAVFAERTQRFLAAWLRADEEARGGARAVLDELRRSGAPAAAPPPLPALTQAWRLLEGTLPARPDGAEAELQALADALDLTPVPGFFAARTDGLGELVTVGVRRLWPVRPAGSVRVTLWWLPPEGGEALEPVRARSEPAGPAAFEGSGFEMFLRPPASAPAEWHLVVELEREGVSVRGVPVPVHCLADPAAALGLAREVLEGTGPTLELARGLLAHAHAGARLPALVSPAVSLQLLGDPIAGRPGRRPRPLELGFRDRDGRERWVWGWLPVEPVHAAIVLVAPSGEPPQAVFEGVLGGLWRDTAKELSALLISAPLPRGATAEAAPAERLDRLHALVDELVGEVPVALVSRGDALDLVQRGLAAGSAPFAAWIAVSPREGAPALGPAEPPTLIVAPGGPARPTPLEGGPAWVGGERELLLDEPLLPALARGWLRSHLAPRPAGGGER